MSARVALIRHFRKQWHSPDPSGKADAVLAAFDSAGYVVVPKEPTEAMVLAAISRPEYGASTTLFYGEIYRAMLAAAQEPTS